MGKKKILLVKVSGLLSQGALNECGGGVIDSVEKFGILVYDDHYEVREVEVDGVYWEDE